MAAPGTEVEDDVLRELGAVSVEDRPLKRLLPRRRTRGAGEGSARPIGNASMPDIFMSQAGAAPLSALFWA